MSRLKRVLTTASIFDKQQKRTAREIYFRTVLMLYVTRKYTLCIKIKTAYIFVGGFFGGNNRARTCDPLLVRQMLSQLSYAPKCHTAVSLVDLGDSYYYIIFSLICQYLF